MVLMIATPAFAADQPVLPPLATKATPVPDLDYFVPHPIPAFQGEFGARYWYGHAKTAYSLYGAAGSSDTLVSRLTFSGLTTNSGELYGRVAFTNGLFVKGYIGGGSVPGGKLQDEDFPPVFVPVPPFVTPYSSTTSDQHNGYLTYASFDVGYDVVRGGDFRLGAFAGYHYFNEAVNAFGCVQAAGNPVICQPPIPASIEGISENNKWQSVRLGLDGSVKVGERFTLSAEGAWLPYVTLNGADTHWLRIGSGPGDFTGPTPDDGNGQGYQFEGLLSYEVTQNATVGVGARIWHMQANGNMHFEISAVGGGLPQPVDWKTDIYGVFAQASFKFGPYPINMGMN
jgi:hypothetical protein